MRLAERLKEALTMDDVLERYGFHIGYNRRMRCPFHEEKTASFLVHRNNRSWKCYGCGAGGTIIDFVMRLYDINFGQACIRLNSDLNLGLTDERPNKAEERRRRAQDFRKQQHEKRVRRAYETLAKEHRRLLWIRNNVVLTGSTLSLMPWYCKEMVRLGQIRHMFDFYDTEGEDEWWKNYEQHIQQMIS